MTQAETPTKKVATKTGQVIWVTGGKGGVGKSTFARVLMHLLQNKGVTLSAYDGDPDNAQLYRYYRNSGSGVQRVAIGEQGKADALINDMDQHKTDVILVDVAAGGSKSLLAMENDMRLLSDAPEMGYRFTVVSVLSRIKDSVNLLKASIDMTESYPVHHIAVKNLYFGEADRFRLFDASKTKNRLLEGGGQVLEMPELFDDTYELLDQQNLTFGDALKPESGLTRAHRSRVYQWLQNFEQELMQARGALGL